MTNQYLFSKVEALENFKITEVWMVHFLQTKKKHYKGSMIQGHGAIIF